MPAATADVGGGGPPARWPTADVTRWTPRWSTPPGGTPPDVATPEELVPGGEWATVGDDPPGRTTTDEPTGFPKVVLGNTPGEVDLAAEGEPTAGLADPAVGVVDEGLGDASGTVPGEPPGTARGRPGFAANEHT